MWDVDTGLQVFKFTGLQVCRLTAELTTTLNYPSSRYLIAGSRLNQLAANYQFAPRRTRRARKIIMEQPTTTTLNYPSSRYLIAGSSNQQPMATESTEKHGLNTSSRISHRCTQITNSQQPTIKLTTKNAKNTKDYKWCITARMWDVGCGMWEPDSRSQISHR
jgi:hypothetical protein